MALEIERKFLVTSNVYKTLGQAVYYRQGYITTKNEVTVRVRIAGEKAFLTLKDKPLGICRNEYEYEIPIKEAAEILEKFCDKPQIEKFRYKIPLPELNLCWEVDEFLGENIGLVVAEIELPTAETFFDKPSWIGEEVTGRPEYYNSQLCKKPFSCW